MGLEDQAVGWVDLNPKEIDPCQGASAGQSDAWHDLIGLCHRRLMAKYRCYDTDLRDELVADFIANRLANGYVHDRFEPAKDGRFGLFLRQALDWYVIKALSRRQDTPRWVLDGELLDRIPDQRPGPDLYLEQQEDRSLLAKALDALERELIDLGDVRRLTVLRERYLAGGGRDADQLAAEYGVEVRRIYNDRRVLCRRFEKLLYALRAGEKKVQQNSKSEVSSTGDSV